MPATNSVDLTTASDYAVLDAGKWSFYYGYEWGFDEPGGEQEGDRQERWGFRAYFGRDVVRSLSAQQLEVETGLRISRWDVAEMLLAGIGLVLQDLTAADGDKRVRA